MKATIKLSILSCLFMTGVLLVQAQVPSFDWAFNIGNYNNNDNPAFLTDSVGNTYLTGRFMDTIDVDPSSSIYNLTANGALTSFLAKYTPSGSLIWAFSFNKASTASSGDFQIHSMTFDLTGNLVICGHFSGGAYDVDPSPNTYWITGNQDGFFAKYDTSGVFLWAKCIGSNNNSVVHSVAVNSQDQIILGGIFDYSILLDPSSSTPTFYSFGGNDFFIGKYTSSGNYLHGTRGEGTGNEDLAKITLDNQDNVIAIGSFSSASLNFNPSGQAVILANTGSSSSFIAKYDQTLFCVWALKISGTAGCGIDDVITDNQGSIYITGFFEQTTTFYPSPVNLYNLTSYGSYDAYIAKYLSNGAFGFMKQIGGANLEYSNSINLDLNNNILICGKFNGITDFDPSLGIASLTSVGTGDGFVAKYDSLGNYSWVFGIHGNGYVTHNEIQLDNFGNLFIAGDFTLIMDFEPSNAVYNLTSNGQRDIFLAKYSVCTPTFSTLIINACDIYTLNNQAYTTSGTYTQTLTNATGCDSTITLNLTITNINDSVLQNGFSLTALQTGATYQWVNCDLNLQQIPGANAQTYIAPDYGNYAVIITLNGCVDTSDCVNVTLGNDYMDDEDFFLLFPNPVNDLLTLDLRLKLWDYVTLSLHSLEGKVIMGNVKINPGALNIDVSGIPNGIYVVKIETSSVSIIRKLIIQH